MYSERRKSKLQNTLLNGTRFLSSRQVRVKWGYSWTCSHYKVEAIIVVPPTDCRQVPLCTRHKQATGSISYGHSERLSVYLGGWKRSLYREHGHSDGTRGGNYVTTKRNKQTRKKKTEENNRTYHNIISKKK
jgi:hypothetical protein